MLLYTTRPLKVQGTHHGTGRNTNQIIRTIVPHHAMRGAVSTIGSRNAPPRHSLWYYEMVAVGEVRASAFHSVPQPRLLPDLDLDFEAKQI